MKNLVFAMLLLTSFCYSARSCSPCDCLPPLCDDENLFPRCKRAYANVEFLYWTIDESALDYAVKQKEKSWAPIDSFDNFATGDVKRANYDWDPGVRVSVGYYNAPKFWELYAEYTYFKACGDDFVTKPKCPELYLNGTFPQLSDTFGNHLIGAGSAINLRFQQFDVLFSRVFDPNPHLRVRLLAGVTSAFFHQNWTVNYFDNENNTSKTKNEWLYEAAGLRVGFSGDWWWKWGLYFTGKATLAGLTGSYRNYARQTTTFAPADHDPNAKVRDLKYKDYRFAQHLQVMVGPSWHHLGDCCCPDFELFLGYELNGWLNLQEIYRSNRGLAAWSKETGLKTGAIAMHGLTVRLTAGY